VTRDGFNPCASRITLYALRGHYLWIVMKLTILEEWKKEVFPLNNEEVEEINSYIKSLQDTILAGKYRLCHNKYR